MPIDPRGLCGSDLAFWLIVAAARAQDRRWVYLNCGRLAGGLVAGRRGTATNTTDYGGRERTRKAFPDLRPGAPGRWGYGRCRVMPMEVYCL